MHHAAYRCRDTEETRKFYEDFLGLPLIDALHITTTMTNEVTTDARECHVLHSFFEMEDGSSVAFFEEPDTPFDFKRQRDFDLHIALEVGMDKLHAMYEKGKELGIETRGISDHGFIHSIYFTDPNGYILELTSKVGDKGNKEAAMKMARGQLDNFAQYRVKSRL